MSKNKAKGEQPTEEMNAPAPELEDGAQDASESAEQPVDIEKLQSDLESARRLSEEYLTMAQRVQADFENFRRRNNAVRAEAYEEGAAAFIKTLLPVVDNLERALSVESSDEALAKGVNMVYKQLCEALEKRGVTVIDRPGEKFDPMLENAVMQGEASEGEPGTVCAVLQKGYKLGDTVLRHAMVKVVAE